MSSEEGGTFVQYMYLTALSYIVKNNLRFICVRWYISDEMDQSVSEKELQGGSLNVGE